MKACDNRCFEVSFRNVSDGSWSSWSLPDLESQISWTCLIFRITSWADSDGSPALASEKVKIGKHQHPDVVHFYSYKRGSKDKQNSPLSWVEPCCYSPIVFSSFFLFGCKTNCIDLRPHPLPSYLFFCWGRFDHKIICEILFLWTRRWRIITINCRNVVLCSGRILECVRLADCTVKQISLKRFLCLSFPIFKKKCVLIVI